MITALIIDNDPNSIALVESKIKRNCSNISMLGAVTSYDHAIQRIISCQPQLLFIDAKVSILDKFPAVYNASSSIHGIEIIFYSEDSQFALNAIRYQALGYLLRPIQELELVEVINKAENKIEERKNIQNNKKIIERLLLKDISNELIGIPTIEGFEYFLVQDIIRCEGLQKCTRIITIDKTNIVSSYNIGEFKKLLERHGFFLIHKSHLINLKYIKRYSREGYIVMKDGSSVPVSRRRKTIFLEQIPGI